MELSIAWLNVEGFSVVDCSAKSNFDLEVRKGADILKVEVKGTTSDECDAILMTYSEVDLHRREKGRTGLIMVYGVRLTNDGDRLLADGGNLLADLGWDVDSWDATPIAFKLTRRTP